MTLPKHFVRPPLLPWQGLLSYELYKNHCEGRADLGADALKRSVLIFPGNETHLNTEINASKRGAGLASVADEFTRNGLGAIGLPTLNHEGKVTKEMARAQVAQLFFAAGMGGTLVLPVRAVKDNEVACSDDLREKLAKMGVLPAKGFTLSFWGGVKPAPLEGEEWLPDYYGWMLLFLQSLCKKIQGCNDVAAVQKFFAQVSRHDMRPLEAADVDACMYAFVKGLNAYQHLEPGMKLKTEPSRKGHVVDEKLWQEDLNHFLAMKKDPKLFINEVTPIKAESIIEITIKNSPQKIVYYPMTAEAVLNKLLTTEDSFRILLTFAQRKKMPWIDVSELSDSMLNQFNKVKKELGITISVRDTNNNRKTFSIPQTLTIEPPPQSENDSEAPKPGSRGA